MKMLHKFILGGTSNTAGICRSIDQHMEDIDCVYRAIPLTRYKIIFDLKYLSIDSYLTNVNEFNFERRKLTCSFL